MAEDSDLERRTYQKQPSVLRTLISSPLALVIVVLGIVCVLTLLTQRDPEIIKWVLGGSATLAVIAWLFS